MPNNSIIGFWEGYKDNWYYKGPIRGYRRQGIRLVKIRDFHQIEKK
jgi:hypothetical protein